MDVLFITTWESQCGVATYSDQLAQALVAKGAHVTVFSEVAAPMPRAYATHVNGKDSKDGTINVLECWNRRASYHAPFGLESILKHIDSSPRPPGTVHVSHEFGLFPDSAGFIQFLAELEKRKINTVVTLHTVTKPPFFAGFFSRLGKTLTTFVVHTHAAAAALAGWSPTTRIAIIPHGVTVQTKVVKTDARTALDVEKEEDLFLVPGFMGTGKGQDDVLTAFLKLVVKYKGNVRLAIVGLCRDGNFQDKLEHAIHSNGLIDLVYFKPEFQTARERHLWFSAADVVVLGSGKTSPYSSSGQLHTALGYGLPIIAKNVPIYRGQGGGVLLYDDIEECTSWMDSLCGSGPVDELAAASLDTAKERSWDKVADMYLKVYSGH